MAVLDDAKRLPMVPRDSLVLLTPVLADEAYGYQLDIWCRTAAERGASIVLFSGLQPEDIPRSSVRVAKRSRMALGCVPADISLGGLIVDIGRAMDAGAAEALSRAVHTADVLANAVDEAPSGGVATARLCELASAASGQAIAARQPEPGELSAPVRVDGIEVDHVTAAPHPSTMADQLARLVIRLTAESASRAVAYSRRASELPIRSQTQLLGEILVAGPQYLAELLPRARSLGLGVDAWHATVIVEVDTTDLDAVTGAAFLETLGAIVMQAVGRAGRSTGLGEGTGWHLAYADHAPVLIRTWKREPADRDVEALRTAAATVHGELRRRWPDRHIRCGVGGVHESVEGLRSSWAEARSTLITGNSFASNQSSPVVLFDDLGLHRTLVEWYTTQTARAAVRDLLAPLEQEGPDKASMMIHTLRVYLDNQGAVAPTATALNLHRNAVSYRIKRILSLLDADLDDPNQRLAVHLACRAWKLC
ncbi:PucR family transcriptional regulator [Allosalinactinospora lopnorensis]|uniref:PucR family transcriptional regulator n=1 Tax=Allosalinactinospora lopnorensis TaxID=1352348 RepID=UPI00138ED1A1|nr:helix-turn-helix domain-containing protein [Allosalinactinospora lopnorensis]